VDQLVDLDLGQIFPWPTTPWANCYIFLRWRRESKLRILHDFSPSTQENCY